MVFTSFLYLQVAKLRKNWWKDQNVTAYFVTRYISLFLSRDLNDDDFFHLKFLLRNMQQCLRKHYSLNQPESKTKFKKTRYEFVSKLWKFEIKIYDKKTRNFKWIYIRKIVIFFIQSNFHFISLRRQPSKICFNSIWDCVISFHSS